MKNKKREWLGCSAVAVLFYAIVYVIFAHTLEFGFLNPWLILAILAMTALDVKALEWWIFRKQDRDKNE